MAASCALGAIAADASSEQIYVSYRIGERLGMAFQLTDDLIDYDSAYTGKRSFMDLNAQHCTLPLIHSLYQADFPEVQFIKRIIQDIHHDATALDVILQFVTQWGGIAYTKSKIAFYHQETLKLIDSYLPSLEYTVLLKSLVNQLLSPSTVKQV